METGILAPSFLRKDNKMANKANMIWAKIKLKDSGHWYKGNAYGYRLVELLGSRFIRWEESIGGWTEYLVLCADGEVQTTTEVFL